MRLGLDTSISKIVQIKLNSLLDPSVAGSQVGVVTRNSHCVLQSGRKEVDTIGNYISKVAQTIQKAKTSSEDHFKTEVAEVFVDHTNTGIEITARLHNAPDGNIPDATITVYYEEKNGTPNVTVTQRQGDQDIALGTQELVDLLKVT